MNEHISADRLISHHRSREDYQDSPANSLTFGYGGHRYVKFTYELLNEDDSLKLKILSQLYEDFSSCESIDLCLRSSDMLSVLLKHLKNQHDQIRSLAIQTIKKICVSALGRKTIIKKDCILEIEALISDKLPNIRESAFDALLDFAQQVDGIEEILSKNTILVDLVDKLMEEKVPVILSKVIQLLRNLMQGEEGTPKALKTEIIARLMNILEPSNAQVRVFLLQIQANIIETLCNISYNYDGKGQIIEKGHIKQLCKYVVHEDQHVREMACLLLCSLTQLNQGKIQVLSFCEFDDIVARLEDDECTVLNAVQLIANLAEHPLGREKALRIVDKIDSLTCIERNYVDATLQVIKWKP